MNENQTSLDPLTMKEIFFDKELDNKINRMAVCSVPLADIDPFPDHPFQVREDDEMQALAGSIKEHGVLSPVIVRDKNDGRYELVSGHRRKRASELAGLTKIPVSVLELSDEQAAILMVDSNCQREKVLPSEKAYAYKMKLDALKRQGKRADLTSAPVEPKSRSNEQVAIETGGSVAQIKRFIRLTELVPPLLQMVDEGKMAFRPAVEISYLPKKSQRELLAAMEQEVCTPSLAQALKMKQLASGGKITSEAILSIMQERKGNQKEQHRIPSEQLSRFFKPNTPAEEMNVTIVKALEMYRKRERSREQTR